jgi:uncharacterized protein (TIGR03086 family)
MKASVNSSPMPPRTTDLAGACAEVARLVAGVREDQLTDPTPCAGTPVAGLLDHLVGLTLAFRLAAEKTPLDGAPRASAESLAGDWRERLPEQLAALAASWREPAAWEGLTAVGGVTLPGGAAGVIGLNEVLVHGWDLAVATGQPYSPDEGDAAVCLAFGAEFAAGAPEARNAIYGPVVPVPADAPAFDRLLGSTGRDPAWRVPAA